MERNGQPATPPEPPPIVRKEGPLATGERFRPFALAALTAALIVLCALLSWPLLPAITWGVALAVIAWPLHAWVLRRPAAIYLGIIGQWGGAAALIVYGVASWIVVDNFVYVRIAGDRMHLHPVPALIAFLGGLVVFGVSGMILGPAILAVTAAVLEVWHYRAVGEELPESAVAAEEQAKADSAGVPVPQPVH